MSEQLISSIDVLLEGIQKAIEKDRSYERKTTKALAIALIDALSGMVKQGKPPQIALSEGINSAISPKGMRGAIENLKPSNQNTALSNENYYSIAVLVKALSASFVAQVEMPETKIVQLLPSSHEVKQVN